MAGYDSVIGDVDFWVYCQPVGFYNVLAMRSRSLEHVSCQQ